MQGVAQKKRVPDSSRRSFLFSNRVREVDHRVAAFAPRIETTLQGPDSFDPFSSEEQRHTGAGGFVRSSTVENHLAFARQAVDFLFQLVNGDARDAQFAQEALPGDKLVCDVSRERACKKDHKPATERGQVFRHALDFAAESIPET